MFRKKGKWCGKNVIFRLTIAVAKQENSVIKKLFIQLTQKKGKRLL